MYNFGIISEGFTDQITIDNILCGYFQNQDLEVQYLYPDFDLTEKKQIGGGWRDLSNYLQIKSFRNAVASFDFVIIQVDTDFLRIKKDAEEFGFDDNYNELTTENLVINIIAKLISKINAKESGFYEKFKNKIIFAISVDSIECWLVAYFCEHSAIERCDEILKETKLPNNIQFSKSRKSRCHEKLSLIAFENRDNIEIVAQKDSSFKHFIQQLQPISL